MEKIQHHLVEWNTQYVMKYVADWSKERLVMALSSTSSFANHIEVVWLPLPRNFGFTKLSLFPFTHSLVNHDANEGTEQGQENCLVAGSAYPHTIAYLQAVQAVGIDHIITVHEQPLDPSLLTYCQDHHISTYHMAVDDRTSPTLSQYQAVMAWIEPLLLHQPPKKVLVHCQGGVGRTNAVIIGIIMFLLVKQHQQQTTEGEGDEVIATLPSMSFAKVMNAMKLSIQQTHRKMILSPSQEEMLKTTWYEHMMSTVTTSSLLALSTPAVPSWPPVDVLLLCGLPASGKSTFSQRLLSWDADHFLYLNRDSLRDRKNHYEDTWTAALQAIGHSKFDSFPGQRPCMILDGCYLTKQARQQCITSLKTSFASFASSKALPLRVWCVAFHRPVSECEERIQTRKDHPTIPMGKTGVKILQSMQKEWQAPTKQAEGAYLDQVLVVQSDEEIDRLFAQWQMSSSPSRQQRADENNVVPLAAAAHFVKYPRTSHLLNLGAATSDDQVCSPDVLMKEWITSGEEVLVEEKIDGANVGLWITTSGQEGGVAPHIEVFNRSHSLMTGGHRHSQFDGLFATWLPAHASELYDLLQPEDEILYGEWVAMTHTVYYNALPDYFLVYDLYSISKQCFYAREVVAARLAQIQCTLQMVPQVFRGPLQSVEQVLTFVRGTSACSQELGPSNGQVSREGIVLRMCRNGQVIKKGKIVRGDFTASIEETGRWDRQKVSVGTAGRTGRGVRHNQLALYSSSSW